MQRSSQISEQLTPDANQRELSSPVELGCCSSCTLHEVHVVARLQEQFEDPLTPDQAASADVLMSTSPDHLV